MNWQGWASPITSKITVPKWQRHKLPITTSSRLVSLRVLSLSYCDTVGPMDLHRSYSIAIRTPPAISPSPVAIPTPFRNP